MDTEDRYHQFEAARLRGELTVPELWLLYLGLGGNLDAFDIDGYLQGLMPLEGFEQHVLAVALNERLDEVYRSARIPLSSPPPETAVSDVHRAVVEELLGWDAPRSGGPDQTD
jgi:hypothetical protein